MLYIYCIFFCFIPQFMTAWLLTIALKLLIEFSNNIKGPFEDLTSPPCSSKQCPTLLLWCLDSTQIPSVTYSTLSLDVPIYSHWCKWQFPNLYLQPSFLSSTSDTVYKTSPFWCPSGDWILAETGFMFAPKPVHPHLLGSPCSEWHQHLASCQRAWESSSTLLLHLFYKFSHQDLPIQLP